MTQSTSAQASPVQLQASRMNDQKHTTSTTTGTNSFKLDRPDYNNVSTYSADMVKQQLAMFCNKLSREIITECQLSVTINADSILMEIHGTDFTISIIHTEGSCK